ncbi:MAG: hypothetical protein HY554_09075 [Elusimicrobia bacterium]|nr:hypothetical protein [Elusimicrobiota bacterium]
MVAARTATIVGAASLCLLSMAARGAPVREAGRERPARPAPRDERFVEGAMAVGSYLKNRGNASARPDGSGTAQNRYQLFLRDRAATDQWRFLGDLVFLTDRHRSAFKPVSMDYYLAAARRVGVRTLQIGRDEAFALDRSGKRSRYWDVRMGLGSEGRASAGGSVGWFFKNDGHSARPDLSGEAFLRYAAFLNMTPWRQAVVRVNADFLTDKRQRRFVPAALDLAVRTGWVFADSSELVAGWEPRYSLDREHAAHAWTLSAIYRFDSVSVTQ